jgi:hypothetical protein
MSRMSNIANATVVYEDGSEARFGSGYQPLSLPVAYKFVCRRCGGVGAFPENVFGIPDIMPRGS